MFKLLLQRTALVIFGLLLGLILLELGMRAAGFVLSSLQERENRLSLAGKDKYVIVCLGESTTVLGDYPRHLEKELNRWAGRDVFAVVNLGIPGTNSGIIRRELAGNLDEYRPDMVIAMVGINDSRMLGAGGALPVEDEIPFYAGLKVYKLFAALVEHVKPMLTGDDLEMDRIYARATREGRGPVAVPEDKVTREQARLYWNEDRFGETEYICRRLLKDKPADRELRFLLARSLREREAFYESEEILVELVGDFPRDRQIILHYARILSLQGKYEEAIKQFFRAGEMAPRDSSAPAEAAVALARQGLLEPARIHALKAIELDPSRREWLRQPLRGKARDLVRKGEWARVVELGDFMVGLGIEDAATYALQGRAHNYLGDTRRAERASRRALELDPREIYALETLGVTYASQRDFEKAEDYFLKAMRQHLDPPGSGPGFPFNELTGLYLNCPKPKYDKLERLCREVLEKCPEDERVMATLAQCLSARGADAEAERCRRRARELMDRLSREETKRNYRQIVKDVQDRGIRMVCVQYPVRPLRHLREVLGSGEGVILVDNEHSFKQAVKEEGVKKIFTDLFAGDFGHFSPRGVEILVKNISRTLISSGVFAGLEPVPSPREEPGTHSD